MNQQSQVRALLARVRRRWRQLTLLRAAVRGVLAATAVLALGLLIAGRIDRAPLVLATLGGIAVVLALAALAWGLWPARHAPSDARVARFIEERDPSLDDRLVSAVDLSTSDRSAAPELAGLLLADADRRASEVDPAHIIPTAGLRKAGALALAAGLVFVAVAFTGRDTARQAFDAASLSLFPSRVTLEVTPGSTRVPAGTALTIAARLVGNRTPVAAYVLHADGAAPESDATWREAEMSAADASGAFRLALGAVDSSFKYRVTAGGFTSPVFEVTVVRPPLVKRIDVQYAYPPALNLRPRTEEDGGDIYAPAGTDVQVIVYPDRDGAGGEMTLADGKTIALAAQPDGTLKGALKVIADGSYRVTLAADGLTREGDTEYFIRTVEDRPPDVRIVKPARDRSVTRLEEVDIEAEADDDFGVDRLELVYAIRGGVEKAVPLAVKTGKTIASGSYTLYVEDLDVGPGDFISYYARARDVSRARGATEARSDIFFLEVTPFEQEFTLIPTGGSIGGGSERSLDDLVAAQKDIIVATWKLDKRTLATNGARSEQDIRAVARAEADLRERVQATASEFRESMMRDPRRPPTGRGEATPRTGQTAPEEDAMTAAAVAMGRAVDALNRLDTTDSLQPEMEALNHLLKAQADVTKRQVSRQQAGAGGGGGNRTSEDLSTLFDRELQREQATNYETPSSTEVRENPNDSDLDRVKELARRQEDLARRQQELSRERERLTPEEFGRQVERLTREQQQLRQRVDEMARQMENESRQQQRPSNRQGPSGQQPQQGRTGQQDASVQAGQGRSGSAPNEGRQSGEGGGSGSSSDQLREAADEMRDAANDLRRNPDDASESGRRAQQKLEQLARQLQGQAPDERRRALGDLQLESRQIAEAQRRIAGELTGARDSAPSNDQVRRLAGEQERLAERTRRLQDGLRREAGAETDSGSQITDARQRAADDAAREIERQQLPGRMQRSADQIRRTGPSSDRIAAAGTQEEIARALDRLADKLASATEIRDTESQRLSDQLAQARGLREEIDRLTQELEKLAQSSSAGRNTAGGGEAARLQSEYREQLEEARELLEQLRAEGQMMPRAGAGLTFESPAGMVLSAPGTESFKQDFGGWAQLRQQATVALQQAEAVLAQRLHARESQDRLASGAEDAAPPEYRQQVDSYFKALATKKKP
jgi:hypothetical protein